MAKEKTKEAKGHVLTKQEAALVQSTAAFLLDTIWRKDGLDDLTAKVEALKGSVSDRLLEFYRHAEKAATNAEKRIAVFESLARAFEAELVHKDAEQNNGVKRTVLEIYGSWRPMRSEMKAALSAGIASEGRTYSQVKAERAKIAPPKGNAKAPGKKPAVTVTEPLAAALNSLAEFVATLDAARQTELAQRLVTFITATRADWQQKRESRTVTRTKPKAAKG